MDYLRLRRRVEDADDEVRRLFRELAKIARGLCEGSMSITDYANLSSRQLAELFKAMQEWIWAAREYLDALPEPYRFPKRE